MFAIPDAREMFIALDGFQVQRKQLLLNGGYVSFSWIHLYAYPNIRLMAAFC